MWTNLHSKITHKIYMSGLQALNFFKLGFLNNYLDVKMYFSIDNQINSYCTRVLNYL